MTDNRLLEIDPNAEVESQVDAFFDPAYQLLPTEYHALLQNIERHMISAVKSALRLPATEPVPPDPARWPAGCEEHLSRFLTPAQRKEFLNH